MISNLFSVFDPSSSFLSSSWILFFVILLFIPLPLWKIGHPILLIKTLLTNTLFNEVSFSLNNDLNSQYLIILTSFTLILLINFSALYPQIFSLSSHLVVTLPLSLLFWLSINLFGWTNNTNHILSHLVPQGTPNALISFMVLIELTSSIIRPITLCVRLTANLIAGHLLITLLGNALISISSNFATLCLISPLILTILESAVACIQAYVFITLITLYTSEIQ